MDKEQELIQLLEKYNQDHIIKLLKKIDGAKRKELICLLYTSPSPRDM